MRSDVPVRRLLCAAVACVATLTLATPSSAALRTAGDSDSEPMGGPLLGSTAVVFTPRPGVPVPPAVRASSYVVADLDSGQVLAAKNAHGQFAPARTLKMLTAITFIPRLDADQRIKATYEAAAVDGTKVGVVPDAAYTVRELMMAMLIMSANDAATALTTAHQSHAAGLKLMNEEAARLHADDTVARTPSGLDAKGQVSSAYDLALIARAGMNMPDFRYYVGTRRSSFSAPKNKKYEIYTHNHLLLNYKGTLGIKNGYTVKARASFVGAAERNGRRLVVALMHGEPLLWKEAARLLNWGFAGGGAIASVGQLVDPDPLPGSELAEGAPSGTAALGAPRPKASGGLNVPMAPVAAAGGIVFLFTALRIRARRRRGFRMRPRSKFSLPPI